MHLTWYACRVSYQRSEIISRFRVSTVTEQQCALCRPNIESYSCCGNTLMQQWRTRVLPHVFDYSISTDESRENEQREVQPLHGLQSRWRMSGRCVDDEAPRYKCDCWTAWPLRRLLDPLALSHRCACNMNVILVVYQHAMFSVVLLDSI